MKAACERKVNIKSKTKQCLTMKKITLIYVNSFHEMALNKKANRNFCKNHPYNRENLYLCGLLIVNFCIPLRHRLHRTERLPCRLQCLRRTVASETAYY